MRVVVFLNVVCQKRKYRVDTTSKQARRRNEDVTRQCSDERETRRVMPIIPAVTPVIPIPLDATLSLVKACMDGDAERATDASNCKEDSLSELILGPTRVRSFRIEQSLFPRD